MFRNLIHLNSVREESIYTTSNSHSRSVSNAGICNNRALAPKKGYGHVKKLSMHYVASIEHDLKMPEVADPINTLDTKST